MTTKLEEELRSQLHRTAAATHTAPDALTRIVERAERRPRLQPSRALAVSAVLIVALAAGLALRSADGGGDGQAVVADRPPQPPALTGTVHVDVRTSPCSGDCVDGRFRFPFRAPEEMVALPTGEWGGVEVLPDGRYLTGTGGGVILLVDPATGREVPAGEGEVLSVAEEAGGTIVILAIDEEAPRGSPRLRRGRPRAHDHVEQLGVVPLLRRVDPGSGAVRDLEPLADDLVAHSVAVGPAGDLALLADVDECCLNRPVVVLLDRDGTERQRLRLDGLLPEERVLMLGRPGLTWGTGDLIAISGTSPEPLLTGGDPPGWTVVLDPSDGALVTYLDGWQGLAWSPDGAGLLVARRTGRRTSELAVVWGTGLSEVIQAGTTELPVVPRHWTW